MNNPGLVMALSAAVLVGAAGHVAPDFDVMAEKRAYRDRVEGRPKFLKAHIGQSRTAGKRKAQHKARMKARKAKR